MKIKFIIHIILFFIIIIFIGSCRDNCQFWKKKHEKDIPEGLKKYIKPYQQVGKTWIYVNSDSTEYDTLSVVDAYSVYVVWDKPCERFESINIKITGTISTNLYQPKWPIELKAEVENNISHFYWYNTVNDACSMFSLIFNEDNSEYKTGSSNSTIIYHDEFLIGNITYKNVIESSRKITFDSNDSITSFLAPDFGIIKYKIGNISFSLLKII